MMLRAFTVASVALLLQFVVLSTSMAKASTRWVSVWATALQPIPNLVNPPPLYRAPVVAGRTVRQIIYPTLSGRVARIHISNAYGPEPLVLSAVTLGQSASGAAVRAETLMPVMFGGKVSVVVPPEGELDSDPIPIPIIANTPYAISLYMGPNQKMTAWHRVSNQVNYISVPGNYVMEPFSVSYPRQFTQYVWVTRLDVQAPGAARVIAAVGDSITDGMRSSLNRNRRWPDVLSRHIEKTGGNATAVVNLGVSGNRLLSDSPCYGDALVRRFERDVLSQPGVTAVILLVGINDINFASMPTRVGLDCDAPHTLVTAGALIAGYQHVIEMAHRRSVRVLGATLTPASLPPDREAIRLEVNRWIRSGGAFDGVVDFDRALRDPASSRKLLSRYDSGDHIHPSDAGYAMLGEVIGSKGELLGGDAKGR